VSVLVRSGAEEFSLHLVAQVVKCSHSADDLTMSKCLWKVLEFYRCPVEHLLHTLGFYFTFQVYCDFWVI